MFHMLLEDVDAEYVNSSIMQKRFYGLVLSAPYICDERDIVIKE